MSPKYGRPPERALRSTRTALSHAYGSIRRRAARLLRKDQARRRITASDLVHDTIPPLLRTYADARFSESVIIPIVVKAMKNRLITLARKRKTLNGSGLWSRQPVGDALEAPAEDAMEVQALLAAIERARERFPDEVRVAELRYFARRSAQEVAELMRMTPRQVRTRTTFAVRHIIAQYRGGPRR